MNKRIEKTQKKNYISKHNNMCVYIIIPGLRDGNKDERFRSYRDKDCQFRNH